jgi:putative tricarboxylic transport membrane protein
MKIADYIFGVIGLGLSLWCYLESRKFTYMTEFTPGPGFMPFWVGVILALLSCYLLIDTYVRKSSKEDSTSILPKKRALYRVGFLFVLLIILKTVMPFLGFPLTVCLFVATILFSLERYSIVKSIGYGIAYSAVTWLVFEKYLEMGFPKGFPGI